jgi:uncharacterized tellurite resistance protein B-like protein
VGLPLNLARVCRDANDGEPPTVVARALTDIHGATGETYLALGRNHLFVFSTKLGSECQQIHCALDSITAFERENNTPFDTGVHIDCGTQSWSLPVPSCETEALDTMIAAWRRKTAGRPDRHARAEADDGTPAHKDNEQSPPTNNSQPAPVLSPVIAFSAALHAMMRADETAGAEELHLLNRLIERPAAVEKGVRFLDSCGLDALLDELPALLNNPQKACLYANLAELAMVDGKLKTSEKRLLDSFRTALGITPGESEQLDHVLNVKNDLSVFEYTDG